MSNAVHPFQKAGFGIAPYRVVGFEVSKYQACQGAPIQPGSSCDFCGTGIMNVYWVRSSDGVKFKVGCDCVRRTDKELVRECAQVRRDAAWKARREAWDAAERAENGGKTRRELWAEERAIRAAEAQARADAREARRMASQWIGKVGKREVFELTLMGHYAFESHYGYQPTVTVLYFLEDAAGNAFVWKTSTGFSRKIEKGESFKAKATVKDHATYKDAKQTVITRLALV